MNILAYADGWLEKLFGPLLYKIRGVEEALPASQKPTYLHVLTENIPDIFPGLSDSIQASSHV